MIYYSGVIKRLKIDFLITYIQSKMGKTLEQLFLEDNPEPLHTIEYCADSIANASCNALIWATQILNNGEILDRILIKSYINLPDYKDFIIWATYNFLDEPILINNYNVNSMVVLYYYLTSWGIPFTWLNDGGSIGEAITDGEIIETLYTGNLSSVKTLNQTQINLLFQSGSKHTESILYHIFQNGIPQPIYAPLIDWWSRKNLSVESLLAVQPYHDLLIINYNAKFCDEQRKQICQLVDTEKLAIARALKMDSWAVMKIYKFAKPYVEWSMILPEWSESSIPVHLIKDNGTIKDWAELDKYDITDITQILYGLDVSPTEYIKYLIESRNTRVIEFLNLDRAQLPKQTHHDWCWLVDNGYKKIHSWCDDDMVEYSFNNQADWWFLHIDCFEMFEITRVKRFINLFPIAADDDLYTHTGLDDYGWYEESMRAYIDYGDLRYLEFMYYIWHSDVQSLDQLTANWLPDPLYMDFPFWHRGFKAVGIETWQLIINKYMASGEVEWLNTIMNELTDLVKKLNLVEQFKQALDV